MSKLHLDEIPPTGRPDNAPIVGELTPEIIAKLKKKVYKQQNLGYTNIDTNDSINTDSIKTNSVNINDSISNSREIAKQSKELTDSISKEAENSGRISSPHKKGETPQNQVAIDRFNRFNESENIRRKQEYLVKKAKEYQKADTIIKSLNKAQQQLAEHAPNVKQISKDFEKGAEIQEEEFKDKVYPYVLGIKSLWEATKLVPALYSGASQLKQLFGFDPLKHSMTLAYTSAGLDGLSTMQHLVTGDLKEGAKDIVQGVGSWYTGENTDKYAQYASFNRGLKHSKSGRYYSNLFKSKFNNILGLGLTGYQLYEMIDAANEFRKANEEYFK